MFESVMIMTIKVNRKNKRERRKGLKGKMRNQNEKECKKGKGQRLYKSEGMKGRLN